MKESKDQNFWTKFLILYRSDNVGAISQRPFTNPVINSLPSELAAAAVAAATNTNSSVSNHSIRGERLFPNQTGIAPLPSLGTNKTDSSTIGGATGTTATVPLPSLASGERNELTRMPSFQQPTAAALTSNKVKKTDNIKQSSESSLDEVGPSNDVTGNDDENNKSEK